MNEQTKKPRVYKRITPLTVAKHKQAVLAAGNNTNAVRMLEPSRLAPEQRAFRIVKKSNDINAVQFIDNQLEQIGVDAINRVGKLVNSVDERIATKNSHFVIDHLRGQAVKRSISQQVVRTVESVLE